MEAGITKPKLVEKEEIPTLSFPKDEVLKSAEAIKQRMAELNKALSLGNLEYSKIKIVFEDSEGLKKVETTVWGVTDARVILKQGIVIPINRILEVVL